MQNNLMYSLIASSVVAGALAGCGGSGGDKADLGVERTSRQLLQTGCAGSACHGYNAASTSLQFYVNGAPWADLHYTVNGGSQKNIRMTASGGNNTYTVGNLKSGDVVRYFFTIGISTGGATDTAWTQATTSATAPTPTPTPGCTFTTWTSGVNYPVGTVVKYPANGNYYKEVAAGANGSDGTDPTISTYYWQPTTCGATTPSGRIVGAYWPNWLPSAIRVKDVPLNYNLIYLFAAQPVGGSPGTTGAVFFNMPGDGRGAATNFNADIQYARKTQGRKVILSVGGAGNSMRFPDRTHSQNFVNSIVALYNQFGGFDGIDWNTYEGTTPDTSEMIWISQQLKQRYPGFLITSPPAPWNTGDIAFCKAMLQAGALDYCAPQYYDGPNLADPAYVVSNIDQWMSALGASHVAIGFGVNNATNYMTPAQAQTTWNGVKARYPAVRGGFDWAVSTDESQGWPFANSVAPLIRQ